MHSDDMSPRVAGLLELHLANGTLVVVILHCQMRIRNHFRVILRLFRHLHYNYDRKNHLLKGLLRKTIERGISFS